MSLVLCLSSLPLFWSLLCLSFYLECALSSLSKPAHFSKSESRNEGPGREKEEGGKASRRETCGSSRCCGQLYEVPLALPKSWSRISSVALVLRGSEECVCVCVCVYMHACGLTLSYVDSSWPPRLYVAQQAPLSMGFCRQEYWSGLACPPLGDLPNPGIELAYPALAGRFLTTSATWEALIRRSLRLNEDIKEPWNDLPGILIRKERDSSEFALCQMRTQEKVAIYTPGEGSHQEPWSWTSHRTMGSKCLLCKPLHLWYCVTAAGADQDTTVLLQVIMKGWVPGIWMAEVPQVTPAQVSREPAL